MSTNPSICIAKVDKTITKQFIFNIINKHKLGNIRLINLKLNLYLFPKKKQKHLKFQKILD